MAAPTAPTAAAAAAPSGATTAAASAASSSAASTSGSAGQQTVPLNPAAAVLATAAQARAKLAAVKAERIPEASWLDLGRRVPRGTYPVPDFPLYPAQVLFNHLVAKAVQVGAITGLVVAPLWAATRGRPLLMVYPRILAVTTGGAFAATVGLMVRLELAGDLGPERVDDRAYRISKNAGQVRADLYAAIGGCVGATAGAVFGVRGLRSVFPAGMTGIAVGTLVAAAETYAMTQQQPQSPSTELA